MLRRWWRSKHRRQCGDRRLVDRLRDGDDSRAPIESLDLVHDPARHLLVGLRDLSGVRGELLDVDTSRAYALLENANRKAHSAQLPEVS